MKTKLAARDSVKTRLNTYDIVVIGLLAALAGVFQVTHGVLGIPTGFGMTVDLVAVPALLALFLFGFEHAMWVLVITAFIITVIAPDSWLGASMKFAATLPMLAVPAFYLISTKNKRKFAILALGTLTFATVAFILSGMTNLALASSIPDSMPYGRLLLGLVPIALISAFSLMILYSWKEHAKTLDSKPLSNESIVLVLLVLALLARGVFSVISNYYYAGPIFWGMSTEKLMAMVPWYAIVGWNAFQGILEFGVAWVMAYKFGFAKRYGKW